MLESLGAQMSFNFGNAVPPLSDDEAMKLMKPNEIKLFKLLPVGRINAVSNEYLSNALGVNTRTIIQLAHDLRMKSRDIGSNYENGYYRFLNANELLEWKFQYDQKIQGMIEVSQAMNNTPLGHSLLIDPER